MAQDQQGENVNSYNTQSIPASSQPHQEYQLPTPIQNQQQPAQRYATNSYYTPFNQFATQEPNTTANSQQMSVRPKNPQGVLPQNQGQQAVGVLQSFGNPQSSTYRQ